MRGRTAGPGHRGRSGRPTVPRQTRHPGHDIPEGSQRPVPVRRGRGRHTPIDLGVVVADDAHAALTTTEGVFRLTIPADHPTYGALLDLFADDANARGRKAYHDIVDGDITAVVRVPFGASADKRQQVLDILHPAALAREEAFRFAWPLIADCLSLCTASISARGIEIQPPCPTIERIPSATSNAASPSAGPPRSPTRACRA